MQNNEALKQLLLVNQEQGNGVSMPTNGGNDSIPEGPYTDEWLEQALNESQIKVNGSASMGGIKYFYLNCPNESQHTVEGDGHETKVYIYHGWPCFKCHHGHCTGWKFDDFSKAVGLIDPNTGKAYQKRACAYDPSDDQLPAWIFQIPTKGGGTINKINEPVFCDCFKSEHHLVRVNGVFYYDGADVTDDFIRNEIQNRIQVYFVERVGRLTENVFVTLSNSCFTVQPDPDERKVYCGDYVTLSFDDTGKISSEKEDVFTLTRVPVVYDPDVKCPTFQKYLKDLFYEEDIPAIQEFIGYCLVPSTRAQAALFIHGKGGEGKSVLRDVLMKLFGHTIKQEAISNLDKAFVIANLENILVCIDDDMQTSLMGDVSLLKSLITSKGKRQVERKHVQKHDAVIFARIIGIGNSFIGSKFDYSDGFYRRQLLIDCKPKTREKDDRFMSDKCVSEIQGVLNWALAGLSRLIRNGFNFSISKRMQHTLDSIRRENDNVLDFIENNIEDTGGRGGCIISDDFYKAYAICCKDNGDVPVKKKTFQTRISDMYRDRKDRELIDTPDRFGKYERKKKVTVYNNLRFKQDGKAEEWGVRIHNLTYDEEHYLEHLT